MSDLMPRDDLVRAIHPGFEIRAAENANGMPTLVSRFIQYDTFTEIDSAYEGHFMERVAAGALKKTLAENRDQIKVLLEHGQDPTVGKKPLGAIQEIRDEGGHAVGIVPLLDTAYVRELVPALKEGLYGSSFKFKVIKEDVVRSPARSEENPQGLPERTISELRLYEFGPVLFPAYAGASAGVRSLTDRFVNASRSETAALKENRLFQRSWEYVMDGLWAMHPPALATILAIIGERRQGYRPTPEEIAERIGTRAEPETESPPGVAVIQISGPIVPHATMMSDLSGAASIADLQTQFREALASPDVSSILLNIDSPGGSVDLVPEFAAEILAARGTKPIVALANTFAASAAYWIASAADEIAVTPSGEVGSIGVWTAHEDISAAEAKIGVKTTLVSAGKYKVEGNPYEPLSEDAQAEMQTKVDAYYQMFVDAVARGRDTTSEAVRSGYGEGRLVMAAAAVKAGLADRVATYDQTIARLEKQTASKGRPVDAAAKTEAAVSGTSANSNEEPGHSKASRSTPEPDKQTTSEHKEKKMEHQFKTVEEIDARLEEIKSTQNEMSTEWGVRAFDADTQTTWDELIEEKEQITLDRGAYLERKAYLELQVKNDANKERGAGAPDVVAKRNAAPENVFDMGEYHTRSTSQEHMSRLMDEGAHRAIEGFRYPNPNIDQTKASEAAEQILNQDGPDKEIAQRLLVHGSPVYRSAFWKTIAKQPLSAEEQRKMHEGMMIEARALTAAGDGGVTVPVQIDPTVLLSSTGAINPFREVSKIVRTTSYQWQGVTSTGITAQYRVEGAVMADNSPTLAAPTINPERADAFVPYTWEAAQDWASLEGEMAAMFSDAKDVLEATKFASGAGHSSNEPQGVLTGAGTVVGSSATTTVGTVDIYALEAALPVRFQPNAVWLATPALFSRIRSQAALGSNSGGIWADSLQVGQPARLLGYPAYKASSVGTAGNLAVSVASTKWGIFGDFSKFAIVDRIGFQVRPIDNLFNGNTAGGIAYPNGMSGLVCYWRNSSGVLASNAFRVGTVT